MLDALPANMYRATDTALIMQQRVFVLVSYNAWCSVRVCTAHDIITAIYIRVRFIMRCHVGIVLYVKLFTGSINPCKPLMHKHCHGKKGWAAYDCLRGLDNYQSVITEDCNNFVNTHRSCRVDIETYCGGKEMTARAEKCIKSINTRTKSCQGELNADWKDNKYLNKYNERRLEERRQ